MVGGRASGAPFHAFFIVFFFSFLLDGTWYTMLVRKMKDLTLTESKSKCKDGLPLGEEKHETNVIVIRIIKR